MEQNAYLIIARIALLLFVAKLLGEVAARLKVPSVLGEIIAGIILGPQLLGLVKPDISIQTVATLGIIILLFIAGLEIDLGIMKRVGFASFFIALLGVLVPISAGTVVFMWLGEDFHAAIFVGSILTATSIGLTLRTLMDLDRFRTRAGVSIVTAAVIDDIIGIFILTMLIAFEIGGQTPNALYVGKMIGLVGSFFVLALGLGWWLGKTLTKWVSRMWVDEALLAFAICLAVGLGWISSNFKVAEITGAFVAGLILNRTPQRKSISEKANVIGYGLPIPVFFAYIGVNTQLSALVQAGWPVLAFLGIAILGKIVGCGGMACIWFGSRESLAIGVGMIPRAEVALIMATLGLQAGIIDARIFAMTVALVFVSNILTPILLKLSFRWADRGGLPSDLAQRILEVGSETCPVDSLAP